MTTICEWMYNEGDSFWEAECGFDFVLIDGTLEENKIRYCPGCGGKIGLSAYEPEEGDFYWTEESLNSVKESLESGFVDVPEWALEDDESFFKWINSVEEE